MSVKHNGAVVEFLIDDLPVLKCETCGEELDSSSTHDRIAQELRRELGILQPHEIIEARSRLKLTQRELAERLGVTAESICRWETGRVIHSRSSDRLLRLFLMRPELFDESVFAQMATYSEQPQSYEWNEQVVWSAKEFTGLPQELINSSLSNEMPANTQFALAA